MQEKREEESRPKISPLSMPLEKTPSFGEPPRSAGVADEAAKGEKRKSVDTQELLNKLYKRIDERIEKRSIFRRADFPLTAILLAVFLSPFFFYGGTELYNFAKTGLMKKMKIELPAETAQKPTKPAPKSGQASAPAVPALSKADREFLKTIASQNNRIAEKLGLLIKTLSRRPVSAPSPGKGKTTIVAPVSEKLVKALSGQNRKIAESLALLAKTFDSFSKQEIQKVVIINNEAPGSFSFKMEKKKLLEISGIDLDDPIADTDIISNINSADVLMAMIDSFNRILSKGGEDGVTGFYVKNTLAGKTQALKRLKEIRQASATPAAIPEEPSAESQN